MTDAEQVEMVRLLKSIRDDCQNAIDYIELRPMFRNDDTSLPPDTILVGNWAIRPRFTKQNES